MKFTTTIAIVSFVLAQCKPDLLIDDFSEITNGNLPGDSTPRQFNLLGGDYGELGAPFVIKPAERLVEITFGSENVGQPEPESNPNTAPTFNYWFAKFDQQACYDLSGYSGIEFELVAPANVNMNFTLTQRSADCQTRLLDSLYFPLTKYITPDGTKKTVFLPFSDYSTNLRGGQFDFKHLKDWTIVNLSPVGAKVSISNLKLKGCLQSSSTQSSTTSPTAAPSTTNTSGATTLETTAISILGFLLALFE